MKPHQPIPMTAFQTEDIRDLTRLHFLRATGITLALSASLARAITPLLHAEELAAMASKDGERLRTRRRITP